MDSLKTYLVVCGDHYVTANGYSTDDAAESYHRDRVRVKDGDEIRVYELKDPVVYRHEVILSKVSE